ncbi:MAG: hypothetical protein BJ554DRAFT_2897, partial [Olpidium bornovanus]
MLANESAATADAAAAADTPGAAPADGVGGEPLMGVALLPPCRSSPSSPSSPAQIPVLAVSPGDSDSEEDSAERVCQSRGRREVVVEKSGEANRWPEEEEEEEEEEGDEEGGAEETTQAVHVAPGPYAAAAAAEVVVQDPPDEGEKTAGGANRGRTAAARDGGAEAAAAGTTFAPPDSRTGEPMVDVVLDEEAAAGGQTETVSATAPAAAFAAVSSETEPDRPPPPPHPSPQAGAPFDGVGVAATTHDRQGRRENNAPSPLLEFRCRVRCVAPGLATKLKRLVERHHAGGCVRRVSENDGRLDLEKSVTELVIVGPPSCAIRACAAVKSVLRSDYLIQIVSAEPTELSRRPPSWTATVDYDGFTTSEAEDDAAAAADSEVDYLNVKHRDALLPSEILSSGGLLKTVAFYM